MIRITSRLPGALTNIIILFWLFFWPSSATGNSLNEIQAKERVEAAVRTSMKLPADHFLRAVRCEDLEDELFSFQVKIKGKIAKFAYFYRITETGYEVISPDEALFHSSTDGSRIWYAAVSSATGDVYGLLGFTNAAEAFNRLAMDANLRIVDESLAKNYTALYWHSVLGADYGAVVDNLHDLKRQVDDMIYNYRLTTNGRQSFEKWWKGFEASGVKPQFGVQATKAESGYWINCTALILPSSKTPAVQTMEFLIDQIGTISSVKVWPLYPRSGARP